MTFSAKAKQESSLRRPNAPCCVVAACYGIACFSRRFDTRGVVLHTDNEFIALWAFDVYAKAGITGNVKARKVQESWEFAVNNPYEVDKLLALLSHNADEPALRIRSEIFECENCSSFFITAAFLCCGALLNPEKGYMLEFVSPRHRLMQDFALLLYKQGFMPKCTVRNGANVIYHKASEQVEYLLATVGATGCALEIMNLKILKDFRNRANRITNCETANIDKLVSANRQTLNAIQFLEAQGVLESLPQPLREAAALRRRHPDIGLAELALQSEKPVSKSGLSHRYGKIREKAAALSALLAGGTSP